MYLQFYKFCLRADRLGRTVYTSVPKAACSTVQRMLANAYARKMGMQDITDPHGARKHTLLYLFDHEDRPPFSEMRERSRFFTVVRNPYVRVLSAYLDKIDGRRKERDFFRQVNRLDEDAPISFADFVAGVASARLEHQDHHWVAQSAICCAAAIRYDFVGSQENFADSVAWMRDTAGLDIDESDQFAPHRQSSGEKIARYYTDAIAQNVYSFYRSDFDLFGYSPDPAQLSPLDSDAARGERLAACHDVRYTQLLAAHDHAARGLRTQAIGIMRSWLFAEGSEIADWADWNALAGWALAERQDEIAIEAAQYATQGGSPHAFVVAAKIELLIRKDPQRAQQMAEQALRLAPWARGAQMILEKCRTRRANVERARARREM